MAEALSEVAIEYSVVVTDEIDGVNSVPHFCGQSAGPSGLMVFESIEGNGQEYCLCVKGECPPTEPSFRTLHAGTYESLFTWNGRNTTDHTDTGEPSDAGILGQPFPPGLYSLKLIAIGTRMTDEGYMPFQVQATRDVVIR